MRALVCRSLTGIAGLQWSDGQAEPAVGAGQVLISVSAAALNFPDLLMLEGKYQHRPDPPFVPGIEGAGDVVAVGHGVDSRLIGRRVMFAARGTLAERVCVGVDELIDVPDGWSWGEAAAFPVAAKTAYHALVHRARLQAGETLLVHGASGGTGHMAVKLGKALGARVIATGGDAGKLEQVRTFGADAVVLTGGDDLADRIKTCAGDRGIDVVFDPVGGAGFEASLKAARFGARILIIGFTAGAPKTVRTNYALIKGLSILGVRAGEAARNDPAVAADYAVALPRLAADDDLRPQVDSRFPLAQAVSAFERLASRLVVGKVVVEMERES